MKTFLAIIFILPGLVQVASASDQIICDSQSFKVSFAVGSEGHVSNMVLEGKTDRSFSGVREISALAERHRRIDILHRSIDVRTAPDAQLAAPVVILMQGGKGHIRYGARKEALVCDWVV
jgi:hypothetical protein